MAVFLDRDGTLIRDVGYLRRVEQIEILPRVPDALRLLREHGFKLVVVTNQSAVARGWLSERDLNEIHGALNAALAQGGARLDGIYYCPHHPTEGTGVLRVDCCCRKPDVGMIGRASTELGLIPAQSYVVGDQKTDIELADRIGATALLIRGDQAAPVDDIAGVPTVADLWHAALWIVEHKNRTQKVGA
ncbi:MAG: D-glycero-alpha-D-manno-heptose-1,7-bisphosphate 7-phosphatase [Candidatus Binatia bacterium]